MADGYARARGGFGVCMGVGGPGITNMLTPLATAYADRSPVLALAGSLPFSWRGRGGFQDATPSGINDVEMVRPVTVFAQEIPHLSASAAYLRNALTAMLSERRPAFLALSEQMQSEPVAASYRPLPRAASPQILDVAAMLAVGRALGQGANVAIYAGNGCVHAGASRALVAFAERFQVPVMTTLRAKGVFPEDHPLALGTFGLGGSMRARAMLEGNELDALLVLGVSLNENNTLWSPRLQPRKQLLTVDIDPRALHPNAYTGASALGDARAALEWLSEPGGDAARALAENLPARRAWLSRLSSVPRRVPVIASAGLHPGTVIMALRKAAPRDCTVVIDSGAHTFFAGHFFESYAPRQWLVSTVMAPMGWALGAAVGAKLARREHPCAVLTGDGCMLMHALELHTAVRYRLPVVYVIINNGALANVYLRAKLVDPARVPLTRLETIDWVQFARSVGADGIAVDRPEQFEEAFARAFAAERPFVIDAHCDPDVDTPNTTLMP